MKVAIIGNAGSGKSRLAQAMAQERGWPVLDLDTVAWEPEKVAVPRAEMDARQDVAAFCAAHGDWIIEGCYAELVAVSLIHSPLLVFLDPGMERCLENCRGRPWETHKFRSEAEQNARLAFLLCWVREYYTRDDSLSLRAHQALFEHYLGPKRRLTEPFLRGADLLTSLTERV
jgi:adenylate kinase family enzyme